MKRLILTAGAAAISLALLASCGKGVTGTESDISGESVIASSGIALPENVKEIPLQIEYDERFEETRLEQSYSAAGSVTIGNAGISFEGYLPKFNGEIRLAGAENIMNHYENESKYMLLLRNGFFEAQFEASNMPVNYYCYLDYMVQTPFERYMSVTRYNESFTGGPTTLHTFMVDNFDLKTGRMLTLEDLFGGDPSANADYTEKLSQLIFKALEKSNKSDKLFKEVDSKNLYSFLDSGSFRFGTEAIEFIFNECLIAPYTEGAVVAAVPYTELKDLLKIDVTEKVL